MNSTENNLPNDNLNNADDPEDNLSNNKETNSLDDEFITLLNQLSPEEKEATKSYAESFIKRNNIYEKYVIKNGRMIKENSGDITIQDIAPQNNISSYQQTFRKPNNQMQIKKADAIGDNVDFKITNNKSNGLTVSVDGENGLENANDSTKKAISSGADVIVNNANQ